MISFFLVGLLFLFVLFATIQDLKTREIANWLTYSFVAFVLAYKAFYSILMQDISFFLFGLGGVIFFVLLGYLFYYAGVFAGGDAKLLFGIGGIFNYTSLFDYISIGLLFILILFTVGVVYTILYSLGLALRNIKQFKKDFIVRFKKFSFILIICFLFSVISFFMLEKLYIPRIFSLFFVVFPLLFIYVKSVEAVCMIQKVSPNRLTEGDWIVKDIRIKGRLIKKTVHGLTYSEIIFLRKHVKSVLIKTGVPFAPAFLIGLVIMIFWIL